MAKGQQKSNREKRKPKAEKAKAPVPTSPLARAQTMGSPKSSAGRKGR